jgi:hypothetical protein
MWLNDGNFLGMTKQNASAVAFAGTFTSSASIEAPKSQPPVSWLGEGLHQYNLFKQNSSPISFGTNFTEAISGLVSNNSRAAKLQWFRRGAIVNNGLAMDCWYAVVPSGGLSSYSDTICFHTGFTGTVKGAASVWRGCAAAIFDANFQSPTCNGVQATSISTASGNVAVLAAFRSSVFGSAGTAGAGFTQLYSSFPLNSQYATFVSAQTNLNVTQTAGNANDFMMVDALVGSGSPPSLISTTTISGTPGNAYMNFSIASANAGDIIYLMVETDASASVLGMGNINTKPLGDAIGVSPVVVIQNCLGANYSFGGNGMATNGEQVENAFPPSGASVPVANITLTSNLQANIWNGSSFTAPLFATVFADSVQADLDLRPAVSSPAKNAASNPGSVHSQSLIPVYQTNWHGTPTPGTPIPAKAARSDIGPALTGSIGALT